MPIVDTVTIAWGVRRMNAYDRVQLSRAKERPTALSYIAALIDDFIEMHGDRRFGDDPAVVAGIGFLNGTPITVIGIEKGGDTPDKVMRNFGSAHPEGYRKALRQMKLAEKFHRPVLCLIDTSGAFCGIGAEERGQGQAIAENLMEMMTLKTPILSIVIGEGGSGGALGLAVSDQVWMMENAYYSVISPEGAASILWKDSARAQEASEALKLTAMDLLSFEVIERILSEQGDVSERMGALKEAIGEFFTIQSSISTETMLSQRYEKFRKIGGIDL